jgi:dimethylamine--corrinoid protein Co-methyltransferase
MLGMPCAHSIASGMGGMRTAGDLVARLQMTRGLRLREAKEYVAGKLKVSVSDLSDPLTIGEVRTELGLGRVMTCESCFPDKASAMEAKFNISELLAIPINCVERFSQRTRRGLVARPQA